MVDDTKTLKSQIQYREYLLDVDEYVRPKKVFNHDAMATVLMYLALLDPETYPTHPGMGLGLVTRWRWKMAPEVTNCEREYKRQIQTYLPWFENVDVEMQLTQNNLLLILITLNQQQYQLVFNTEEQTLRSL